ncbi:MULTISPECIES: hypothetical protein [Sphingomonadaceae]|jgi:hypothetical protein|uniref:hypothetical protein n=2 Tax=Sphingomonadales TaxID=204457 RepID=UPI00068653F8|nr:MULTISPECIES: hypothetical protein [Sphingomonadaceae]MCC4253917.1 hypothetical protein [Sphingobium naphthae]MDK8216275.1 hypothetical protein [Sphingomonas sp. UMB7805-LC452B]HEV7435888.1 hypothetical protein [Pseudorhizobium sp.]HJO67882.1 hypothetical protein [Sphingomonas sanguinis]
MRVTRELSTSLLVAGGLATITLAGCRAEDTVSDRRHDSASLPALIGEHLYTCEDGTQLDGDFMLDGLTLDLTIIPGGKPSRLTAPDTGKAYAGNNLTLVLTGTDTLKLDRMGEKSLVCHRTTAIAQPGRGHPP